MEEFLKVREVKVKYTGKPKKMDKVNSPESVLRLLGPILKNETKEHFFVIFLNNKNEIHGWQRISTGTVSESMVHPREVFQGALLTNASSILVMHNHPSGDLKPSHEDTKTTKRLVEAGLILGIPVLDHIIISDGKYMSFKEDGLI